MRFVAFVDVGLVHYQGTAHHMLQPENGGCRGSPHHKGGFVTERPNSHQEAGLAGTVITKYPEVRYYAESVVDPGEKHIILGDGVKRLRN